MHQYLGVCEATAAGSDHFFIMHLNRFKDTGFSILSLACRSLQDQGPWYQNQNPKFLY